MAKSILRRVFKSFSLSITIFLGSLFLIACVSSYINPSNWWVFGFIGLIVPYLILLLFFAFIFWLIAKPVYAWIPLICLTLGWQQMEVAFAWHLGSGFNKKKSAQNIRVVDWNVRSFNGLSNNIESKRLVRNEIADIILKIQADIVCLQEFNNSTERESADNISLFTKTFPYYYFSRDYLRNNGSYQSGSIIFSKFPIIDSGKTKFPVAESLLFADIQKGDDTFRIFTTHMQSFKFKKEDYADIEKIKGQEEESVTASKNIIIKMKRAFERRGLQSDIVRSQKDLSQLPTIIAGDFNDVPNSYPYFNIKGNWQDCFLKKGFGIGRTYLSLAPTLRIDYILADNRFIVKQFDLVDEDLSDHMMLVTDLRINK